MIEKKHWWHKAVFYHIYPRSFADSTNNGIGDLRGIINHLDYVKDLGVDAIWFSPFFSSPQVDFGYDITDFNTIHPEYGSMNDFEELLEKAHDQELKVILDIVLNHTSNEHPWFLESKTSRTNDKHDWYVWLDGKGSKRRKPPTNWNAMIGGSAWKWCTEREQYYLHQFLPSQPDLNWRNSEVQEAMYKVFRFWLDKGVDGFRLDIIHTLFEDKLFRNNPFSFKLIPSQKSTSSLFQDHKYNLFQPETYIICNKLREIVEDYQPARVLIGEATGIPEKFKKLMGEKNNGLNLVFNFYFGEQKFSAKNYSKAIKQTEEALKEPYWPCYVFSNHDNIRMISRLGNNQEKARLAALLLLTIRGTPFIYYGEELGMLQVKVPKEQRKDPIAFHKVWGIPIGSFFGRDGCRTPMQWNDNHNNAGFSPDKQTIPWLPISQQKDTINVEKQMKEKNSMLNYYKQLLKIRKENITLQTGNLEVVPSKNRECLVYKRIGKDDSILIILNFSKSNLDYEIACEDCMRVFSTKEINKSITIKNTIKISSFEGVIVKTNV